MSIFDAAVKVAPIMIKHLKEEDCRFMKTGSLGTVRHGVRI